MKNPALITVAAIGLLGLSAGAQASPSLCDAAAGNLVQNCGFEAGLNSWSQAGLWPSAYPTWNEVRSDYANSGLHSMGDGNYSPSYPNNPQGLGGVSQIISDVAGAAYNFSFWIMPSVDNSAGSDPGGVPKQKYVVYWNGTLLLDQSSQPWTPWTNFSYTVVGTGSDTITFEGYSDQGYNYLDDVQVVAVPEPTSLALLGLGVVGLLAARRCKAT